jgi:O-methyltransferase
VSTPFELLRRASQYVERVRSLGPLSYLVATRDLEPDSFEIFRRVRPYTMTTLLRIHSLLRAVDYVVRRDLDGAFVECGVWRGGSVLAMLLELSRLGATHYDVYLYDTFEGMTRPGLDDTSPYHEPALATWNRAQATGRRLWHEVFGPQAYDLQSVRKTILASGYPAARIHFVKGPVEQTIPAHCPERIALLRLDTDFYESTLHELAHLYPRLGAGGVLIVDDYGEWQGCRKAVDQYFAAGHAAPILLNRIDYTARLGIKA